MRFSLRGLMMHFFQKRRKQGFQSRPLNEMHESLKLENNLSCHTSVYFSMVLYTRKMPLSGNALKTKAA